MIFGMSDTLLSLKVEIFLFWQEYSSKSLEVCIPVVHVLLYVESVCFLRKCLVEKKKVEMRNCDFWNE